MLMRHILRSLICSLIVLWVGSAAAFTDPTLRDDCDRTENPLSHGGQWAVGVFPAETGVPEAIGTVCDHSGAGTASAWWQATSFAANQAVSAIMPDATTGVGVDAALYLRIQTPGTPGFVAGWYMAGTPVDPFKAVTLTDGQSTELVTTACLKGGLTPPTFVEL
jgi:hypothetical protein